MIGALAGLLGIALAQPASPPDVWAPLRFLVGRWEGTASGKPGVGKTTREYRFELNGRFLVGDNRAVYAEEIHEDRSIFSYDGAAKSFMLRQFHGEGFVNEYTLTGTSPLEFVTRRIENIPEGWRAREAYQLISPDEFIETFALAAPDKDFEVYSESRLKRVK